MPTVYAFKHAPVNVLAPIIYFEIVGGAGVGYWLFGHIPSATTIIGISLVVSAGLLIQRSISASTPMVQSGGRRSDQRTSG